MPRQIAIRLGTEGKAQVVADLDAIAATGDAAFNRLARSAVKAGRDADAAMDFAQRQATKLAALLPGLNPTKLDMAAGVRDGIGKSAESSAAIFEAAYAKMEARATALRAAIDPAYGAQQRFDGEMAEARTLISAGAISLDDYVAKLRQEQAALDAVSVGHGKAGNSAGAQRAAMQGLSYQLQDTFTQLSMGTNALQVIAVQGGQVAGQFSNLEGKAGNFARFMIGPYGLAITAALLVGGPLLSHLFKMGNAIDEGVDKLKKDATETENTRLAKERFARSAEGVAISIREQSQALADAVKQEKSAAERANILAKENYALEMSHRRVTAALLEQAIAQENVDRQRSQAPGQRGELGTLALTESSGRVAGLQTQLQANQKAIDDAKRNLMSTRIDLATESAARSADPMAQIKKQYDDQATAARNAARARIKAGQDVDGALTRELATIERNRAAAVKAEQDKQEAVGETSRQYGREVTSAQAAAIARAAGLQVNSADRSTARQQQLYDAWIAQGRPKENPVAKPGTSAHEKGNALDIQFEAGVTAKKIRDAFAAEGVRLTKVFAETGHWHVEWARTAEQRTAEQDAAKATRDLAAANRELDSDLAEVVKQFDPARAAAEEYRATLAKIDALLGAGKITRGEASGYKMDAFHEEQARQAETQLAQFRTLFGTDDPLAGILEEGQRARDAAVEKIMNGYQERADVVRESLSDLRNFGSNALDTLFSTNAAESWGQRLKSIFGDLQSELVKLALLNPLKNLINGDKALPTIGSAIANIGKLFKPSTSTPKLASGTEYWSGGTALLGEHGPEQAYLPAGTRVTPAGATRRSMNTESMSGTRVFKFDLRGAVVTQDLLEQMNSIGDGAALRGAYGGSQMAQRDVSRARDRQLA